MTASDYIPKRELLRSSIPDRLKEYIVHNGFRVGDALPAESELARQLGISRPSLREAIRVLQTLGVLESRHGTGTFVGQFSLSPLTDGLTFSVRISENQDALRVIGEMLEVREMLESELIASIHQQISLETIDELQRVVHRMRQCAGKGEEFSIEDRMFHRLLYLHLGSPLAVQLVHGFWEIFDRLHEELPAVAGALDSIVQQHQAIVDALRNRDVAASVMAMQLHFQGIRRRIVMVEDLSK